jgi:hypothetical protein
LLVGNPKNIRFAVAGPPGTTASGWNRFNISGSRIIMAYIEKHDESASQQLGQLHKCLQPCFSFRFPWDAARHADGFYQDGFSEPTSHPSLASEVESPSSVLRHVAAGSELEEAVCWEIFWLFVVYKKEQR